ncbi:glucose 1-dehydrogenase [Halioxenophilus sp. WMMB6]|uniref:SDR family NAD(P)-dependent oxidoreductase n=1 Tax=Halioxenophilus sp. WMMB6 TaxID=3073815 RepID=UPI00295EDB32|nr:glucose 1-dehydrogenase [Halioxenophilus sp. WMMB6]
MNRINNRVAVVTGGAAGIGSAVCRFLARDGADVAIWDWNTDNAEAVAEEIRGYGRRAMICKVNVANQADVLAAAKKVHNELGPVGILVNNAAISPEKDFVEISEEDWDRVFDINLKGTFFCTQAVINDMIDNQWGRVVNISSSSAQSGARRMVHYAATKGGVIAFTKALAQEVAPLGITVNNVPPSTVYTDGLKSVESRFPNGLQGYVDSTIPVKRVGQPEDIANAVAFLASEDSGFITGVTLSVNGGRYML